MHLHWCERMFILSFDKKKMSKSSTLLFFLKYILGCFGEVSYFWSFMKNNNNLQWIYFVSIYSKYFFYQYKSPCQLNQYFLFLPPEMKQMLNEFRWTYSNVCNVCWRGLKNTLDFHFIKICFTQVSTRPFSVTEFFILKS